MPQGKYNIGRVDHFTKTSIKTIVNACIKQVIQREGEKGTHVITIELSKEYSGPVTKTLKIKVKV